MRTANPADPDYIALYASADLDAFVELHGHIRTANPGSQVKWSKLLQNQDGGQGTEAVPGL